MSPTTIRAIATAAVLSTTLVLAACGEEGGAAPAADPVQAQADVTRLSANRATEAELQTIHGVGETSPTRSPSTAPTTPKLGRPSSETR